MKKLCFKITVFLGMAPLAFSQGMFSRGGNVPSYMKPTKSSANRLRQTEGMFPKVFKAREERRLQEQEKKAEQWWNFQREKKLRKFVDNVDKILEDTAESESDTNSDSEIVISAANSSRLSSASSSGKI